jgi:copper chaperone NosL
MVMKKALGYLIVAMLGLLVSCGQEPQPIQFGSDSCEHCKMTIMDQKYGSEIITSKGKIFKFDAIECMLDFKSENAKKLNSEKDNYLVINIAAPGELINANTAFFLKDKAFSSPMGANLAAFPSEQLAQNNLQNSDGLIFNWEELLMFE